MKTTIEFLDAVKAKTGAPSDYAAAKLLGITRSQVSKYRTGQDYIGDKTAITIAKILNTDPGIIVSAVHAERAKDEAEKAVWKDIFERLGGLAASILLVFSFAMPSQDAQAVSIKSDNNVYYVKR